MTRSYLLFLAVAAVLIFGMAAGCPEKKGVRVQLLNSGRDPVHIAGVRIGTNQEKALCTLVGMGASEVYTITRNEINLGTLTLESLISPGGELWNADVTMTESTYFHLAFVNYSPGILRVTYSGIPAR